MDHLTELASGAHLERIAHEYGLLRGHHESDYELRQRIKAMMGIKSSHAVDALRYASTSRLADAHSKGLISTREAREIVGLKDPTEAHEAATKKSATKGYVDAATKGLNWISVKVDDAFTSSDGRVWIMGEAGPVQMEGLMSTATVEEKAEIYKPKSDEMRVDIHELLEHI